MNGVSTIGARKNGVEGEEIGGEKRELEIRVK
jgi:hypothetical protein